MSIILSPTQITDEASIAGIKGCLDRWSAGLPFSPSRQLGTDSRLIEATQFYEYTLQITTDMTRREFEVHHEPFDGGAVPDTPLRISSIKIWEVRPDVTGDCSLGLSQTKAVLQCGSCGGHGKEDCNTCNGSGAVRCRACKGTGTEVFETTSERQVRCQKCGGTGKRGNDFCLSCFGRGKVTHRTRNQHTRKCGECRGRGEVGCTHCNGRGQITCSTCRGSGRILEYYSIEQKHETPDMGEQWVDPGVPEFDQSIYELDQHGTLDRVRNTTMLFQTESVEEVTDASPDLSGELADAILGKLKEIQDAIWGLPDTRIHSQSIVLYKWPAIVECRYEYQGKHYRCWINTTNGQVREQDDGLITQLGTTLHQDAVLCEKKGEWQKALYLSSKAMVAKQSKDVAEFRANLYGLLRTAVTFPAWLVVITFACFQFSYVRTTEGMVSSIMSLILLWLFHLAFSKDLAIKARFGLWSLLFIGVVLGVAAAPIGMSNGTLRPGWLMLQCLFTLIVVVARTRPRTRIADWDKFLQSKPDCAAVVRAIEGMQPSVTCSILSGLWLLTGGGVAVVMLAQSGLLGKLNSLLVAIGAAVVGVGYGLCVLWQTINKKASPITQPVPYLEVARRTTLLLPDSSAPSANRANERSATNTSTLAMPLASSPVGDSTVGVEQTPVTRFPAAPPAQITAATAVAGLRISGAAITSLVLGIVGILCPFFVFSIPATIFAIIGLRKTGDGRANGRGIAIAGVTLGTLGILLSVVMVIAGIASQSERPGAKAVADPKLTVSSAPMESLYEQALRLYRAKEYERAIEAFSRAASTGNASAQSYLGFMYHEGMGTKRDDSAALKHLTAAAGAGEVRAQYLLGVMFRDGDGVATDYGQAVKWFRAAAEQRDVDAQWALGRMYYEADGVIRDYEQAARWFTLASEQNHVKSQGLLGAMYFLGEGVPKNSAEAIRLMTLAGQKGDAMSQYNLGLIYLKGSGIPKDTVKAKQWLTMAADLGYGKAKTLLREGFDTVAPASAPSVSGQAQ